MLCDATGILLPVFIGTFVLWDVPVCGQLMDDFWWPLVGRDVQRSGMLCQPLPPGPGI